MKRLVCVLLVASCCPGTVGWAQGTITTITVTLDDPQQGALAEAIADVLGITFDVVVAGYRFEVTPPSRLEAVEAFFDTLPYSDVLNVDGNPVAPREHMQAYTDFTPLYVRLRGEPAVAKEEITLLEKVYLTRLREVQRPLAKPGAWFLVVPPRGVLPQAFAEALSTSPLIAEVDVPRRLEHPLQRDGGAR